MSRRIFRFTLMLMLILSPISLMARPQQVTADAVSSAQANAQTAEAQYNTAQAAATQAASQATAAQNAWRDAITNFTKAPAGPLKTAAQNAMLQAQKTAQQAQLAARAAASQANAARMNAVRTAQQANALQAALSRQTALASAQAAATQTAAAKAPAATATAATAATSATSATGGKSGGSAASSGNSGVNAFNSVWGTLTGGGKSSSGAAGNAGAAGTGAGAGAETGAGNAVVGGTSSTARNARGSSQPAAAPADSASATQGPARKAFGSSALGMGQSTDSLLTVYGCSRMGTQVVCDTDFSNQNNSVTQVSGADEWKDVYLQDDAGDNHMRAMGVFENDNGDQRTQITLPYGEKSRYILVFNGVPATVKTVKLKSTANVLDVEDIPVANPSEAAAQSGGAATDQGTPGVQQATAPSTKARSKPPRS